MGQQSSSDPSPSTEVTTGPLILDFHEVEPVDLKKTFTHGIN
jgi:hypothetical protein